jgi:hypothetical protein
MTDSAAPVRDVILLRHDGTEMKVGLEALIVLIRQSAVSAQSEVMSEKLTRGEWRKLGDLDLFRVFGSSPEAPGADTKSRTRGRKRQRAGPESVAPAVAPTEAKPGEPDDPGAARERNLRAFFDSVTVNQLRLDSVIALVCAATTALLGTAVHGSPLVPLAMAAAWSAGFLLADRSLFQRWILRVRETGRAGLPWQSRFLLIAAIAASGYFMVAGLLPLLPAEGWLVLLDAVVGILLALASGVVWRFRVNTLRMKRVFRM